MAIRKSIKYFSDVTGDPIENNEDVEHVKIFYQGKKYILDFDKNNLPKELGELTLKEAVEKGREETQTRDDSSVSMAELHRKVRAWASENGHPVGARGIVAQSIVDKYLKEHPEDKPV